MFIIFNILLNVPLNRAKLHPRIPQHLRKPKLTSGCSYRNDINSCCGFFRFFLFVFISFYCLLLFIFVYLFILNKMRYWSLINTSWVVYLYNRGCPIPIVLLSAYFLLFLYLNRCLFVYLWIHLFIKFIYSPPCLFFICFLQRIARPLLAAAEFPTPVICSFKLIYFLWINQLNYLFMLLMFVYLYFL